MEGKNGLKIVCDSRAGFSTEQSVFLANNLAKKNAIAKTKAKCTEIFFCAGRTILHSM
ncbi:hypothetical protein [Escherichia sp. E4208]|uniref:hypothetical protein n=1 Tax=Escherichia sp. E4208 TaxID=2044463 RepID=UPI0014367720|nr:hypothetical protein [Escherichia sp. E4208]